MPKILSGRFTPGRTLSEDPLLELMASVHPSKFQVGGFLPRLSQQMGQGHVWIHSFSAAIHWLLQSLWHDSAQPQPSMQLQ